MKISKNAAMALFFLVMSLATSAIQADEPQAPESFWLDQKFSRVERPLSKNMLSKAISPPAGQHSLKWPVQFQDAAHTIANSMVQFQAYGGPPYYHGGCDLRVQRGEKIFAPLPGKIEAGHYGYTMHADGSSTKYWKAWPQTGEALYFEFAIITADGYRLEFHHVDRSTLAPEMLKMLNAGGGSIAAGTYIANSVAWPSGGYHHVHYNIIDPQGQELNPEFYSELVPDHVAPQVRAVLASMPSWGSSSGESRGQVLEFGNGQFTQAPDFFAVVVTDKKDGSAYAQPPVLVGIQFESREAHSAEAQSTDARPAQTLQFFWDFRERLVQRGVFANIWSVFVDSIRGPQESYSTRGGYGVGESVIRIPVPKGARGKFRIHVSDLAQNKTEFIGSIQ